ncbi:MAG: DUF3228 family protein [Candidatus Obscuribacter sp.]|nr:DUF3228 family protein [Candidatus Obscuribacter sp.]
MTETIALNPMVRRQKRHSKFSHFEPKSGNERDTWSELLALISDYLATNPERTLLQQGKLSFKVSLPEALLAGFYSGVVPLHENIRLGSFFAPRKGGAEGEAAFVQTVAINARKTPAKAVEVIIYHRDELNAEERTGDDGTGNIVEVDATWQVVSINARITTEPEPPTPQAMARNMACALGLPEGKGGTARTYTAEQFAHSILYWSQHAMVASAEERSLTAITPAGIH